eukprot:scaffold304178_cov38-Prasinocladus_malaysianus.AAC.1
MPKQHWFDDNCVSKNPPPPITSHMNMHLCTTARAVHMLSFGRLQAIHGGQADDTCFSTCNRLLACTL